jgi:hypothetical protein
MLQNHIYNHRKHQRIVKYCLLKKPNNNWRFCIDYRSLNACCTSSKWPIPNIKMMFARIGAIKPRPKYFAKIDFTSGYHQAPLSKASRASTALITVFGVFEWLRVPMGPTGSASYFQQMICIVVLVGVLYLFVEVYIDDILVHADTEDSLVERLEIVFGRFRKHKITLNPEKCLLGMSEVDFVGHTISKKGITFSRNRINKVLDISPPTH